MYALDAKSDDGLPQQGQYRADTTCAGSNAYTATSESTTCTALIVIGN